MTTPMLEIRDLHVRIEEREILKGVNLIVPKGEVHAIMGRNGSGKFGVFSRSTRNPYDKSTVRHLDRQGTGLDYWDGGPGAEGNEK